MRPSEVKTERAPAQVGDVWHRVEGWPTGDEVYEGVELNWTTWKCVKQTPRGAWFKCVENRYSKQRFALTSGALALSRTKKGALDRLIARKKRHLNILRQESTMAQDTLDAALAAHAAMTAEGEKQ